MVPELIACFQRSVDFVGNSVADLSDEEMVAQRPGVPNHAAWTLGHLIFSCQAMAEALGEPPWLDAHWESQYGYGSSPAEDAAQYPLKSVLTAAFTEAARRLREAILRSDELCLAEPLPGNGGGGLFPATAHALLQVVAAHTAYHAGQLAVWRQAIGRPSAGVFL